MDENGDRLDRSYCNEKPGTSLGGFVVPKRSQHNPELVPKLHGPKLEPDFE